MYNVLCRSPMWCLRVLCGEGVLIPWHMLSAPISSPLCLLTWLLQGLLTSSSYPLNTWTNLYQHSGARWQTMPSFPFWSRWCSWPGCATPFLTSIRFVLHPELQRNKKQKLISACRTGYAMCAELRFSGSQPAEAVRTACHSNVGFTSSRVDDIALQH